LVGSKNKEALDFKSEFKRIFLEEVNVRRLVRVLLRKAEQGVPWALQEALDRGLGKAVQFQENKVESGVTYRVLYRNDVFDEATGKVMRAPAVMFPDPNGGPLLGKDADEAHRLLEKHEDEDAAAGAGQDYIDACKRA
jgi:hypothetical protein